MSVSLHREASIGSALKTLQSHTIKYREIKIVPESHRGGQMFYGTEKIYSEEAQTSAYEQPKHHE